MFHRIGYAITFIILFTAIVWAQGSYYSGIDTSRSTFVSDLHNLIYPHTRISYDSFDETNIANFASRDTVGGQRAVDCVYTGFIYVYTPPFTWAVFSREHTYCQSWMPSRNASNYTSLPEYSDQHHIYPTHQNFANVRRSNHPLGKVATVSYQYLEGKLGTDSIGRTVYEPRDSHKGDAARALFYMAVCYNGVGGYDWTFNNLNTITLPDSLSEAPEDVNLMIQWTKQDPPDDWEKSRNEYVYSIQGNRNPFIDHPEYIDVIDFNTLTKKSSSSPGLEAEPSNYVTSFTATLSNYTTIQLSWTDAIPGSQVPSGYLLLANTTNSFTDPVDGTSYANDVNLTDGYAAVNISYGTSSYTFIGLNSITTYYFRMYSVNGTGNSSNYKTDGAIPYAMMTTESSTTHLVVYEIYGGGGNSGSVYTNDFIILFNPGSTAVNVTGWSVQYAAAAGSSWSVTPLNGYIPALSFYLIQEAKGAGGTTPLPTPDAIGTIAMSATAGKVALCNSTTALTGTNPTSSAIIDFVGYGSTANAYEGSGPAPAPSNTTAIARKNYGDDSNDNAYDFLVSTVDPKNSSISLPVEITFLDAAQTQTGITLQWKTATEVNNYGFDVERRCISMNSSWMNIVFINGNGTSNTTHTYVYSDNSISSGRYCYRLKQIDNSGAYKYSQEVEVEMNGPTVFMLNQNYPNPANPSTNIKYALPASSNVRLSVFNVLGQQVVELVNHQQEAGWHNIEWKPDNTSGIYFYRFEAVSLDKGVRFVETKKLLFLK